MHSTTRHIVSLVLGLSLVACGGGETEATTPPPSSAAPTTVAEPTTITLDAPAITVHTVAAPRFSLVVAHPGELQLDATGMPRDVQLTVLDNNGWNVASDGDSGDGLDARLATFLAPATYTVRVHEYNHVAATAHVSARALTAFTPAATVAAGAPPATVVSPAGDWDRAASSEIAITVATAGNYRITAVAADSSTCIPYITLIQNDAVLTTNSYGGPNNSALIDRALTPGNYTLRLRDSSYRACSHVVTVAAQP